MTLPSGDVTVTLAQTGTNNPDVTFDTDAAADGNQDTLSFTAANWNRDADGDGQCGGRGRRRLE